MDWPSKLSSLKVARGLQPRVEEEPAHFEVFLQRRLPIRVLRVEQLRQVFAACSRVAVILDLKPLAVVGHNREQVRAGPGALARPQRLQQAQRQGGDSQDFQVRRKASEPAKPGRCR